MSVTYGFYDSLNHDRTYSTLQFSSIFDGIISDGVYATYLDALEVAATDPVSMDINVKPGRAWFNHTWTLNDAILVLTVEAADVALPRIDTVVLEVNSGTTVRANRIFIKKGTPASSPAAPDLIHGTGGVYQYGLANIRVAKQADITTNGGIRAQDITNLRGTSATPFVSGLIDTIDVDSLITQWGDQFDDMFEELEEQISQAASQTLIDSSVTTQKIANGAVTANKIGSDWVDLIYPVGSLYMSANSTSPASMFGGTWERIKDRFLLSAGDTYSAGSLGGSATKNLQHYHTTGGHTLTESELPKISGSFDMRSWWSGGTCISNLTGKFSSSRYGSANSINGINEAGQWQKISLAFGGGGSHSHGNTGNGLSANQDIMPPYLAVYVWERTA